MRLRTLPDEEDAPIAAGDETALVARAETAPLAPIEASGDPSLAAVLDPAGPLSGSISHLRVQLAGVRRADGSPARLIAIAGIDVAEEAGLVTAALAVSIARAGYRTLLVDACLRRPTLHALFGCGNTVGLTTLLPARRPGEAIQPTDQPRLSLLASGPAAAGDEAMLDNARLFDTLRTLGERTQSILVLSDGEPGLVAGTSEGFDGAVLVVRRDVSSTRRLAAAAAALAERGTRLIGVVCVD